MYIMNTNAYDIGLLKFSETAQVYISKHRCILCILETPKQVLWQTVKTQIKCSIICTVC